ncbi:MAG: class I SAM-dependent methyltransferase [Armatimonadota bacterium]
MIPTAADRDAMLQTDLYREMLAFSDDWRARHGDLLAPYGKAWCTDPMRAWSRQWEYPWVARQIQTWKKRFLAAHMLYEWPNHLRFLDAGSGVTFFPFYLRALWHAEVTCLDIAVHWCDLVNVIDSRYAADRPVHGEYGDLARMRHLPDNSVDVAVCISVLEHTPNPLAGLAELQRVVRPGGLLVCTWDIPADRDAYPDALRWENLIVNGLALEV